MPEAWLRGPIEGVPTPLMPVAHSLVDAFEEIEEAVSGLDAHQLWARPGSAASVGLHICGALDRLLTYARGEGLTPDQCAVAKAEAEPGDPPATAAELLGALRRAITAAVDVIRATPVESLHDQRAVGRAERPSSVLGLLFHAAEHTRRHAGQVIATCKVVQAGASSPEAVRASCIEAATRAWEDAGLRGLCGEGRFEAAVGAVRMLDLTTGAGIEEGQR